MSTYCIHWHLILAALVSSDGLWTQSNINICNATMYISKKPNEWKLVMNGQSLLMTAHILRCTNRWIHACTHSLRSTKQLHTTSDQPLRQTTATLTRPPQSPVMHTAAAHCYYIQLGLQVHMYVNDLLGKWGFVHIAQCKGFVTNGITGYYATWPGQ